MPLNCNQTVNLFCRFFYRAWIGKMSNNHNFTITVQLTHTHKAESKSKKVWKHFFLLQMCKVQHEKSVVSFDIQLIGNGNAKKKSESFITNEKVVEMLTNRTYFYSLLYFLVPFSSRSWKTFFRHKSRSVLKILSRAFLGQII